MLHPRFIHDENFKLLAMTLEGTTMYTLSCVRPVFCPFAQADPKLSPFHMTVVLFGRCRMPPLLVVRQETLRYKTHHREELKAAPNPPNSSRWKRHLQLSDLAHTRRDLWFDTVRYPCGKTNRTEKVPLPSKSFLSALGG